MARPPGNVTGITLLAVELAAKRLEILKEMVPRATRVRIIWADGHNIRIDVRWATTSDAPSMQRFAKELVALQPDVILSHNTPTTATLMQHTRTIPIVFAVVSDPIGSGFVASFPRPGGNVTGFTNIEPTRAGKWPLGAIFAPLAVEAQQPGKVWRIGWLSPPSAETGASELDALRDGHHPAVHPCASRRDSRDTRLECASAAQSTSSFEFSNQGTARRLTRP